MFESRPRRSGKAARGVADRIGVSMAQRTCTIEGCEARRIARGWCHRHYKRWQVHGAPTGVGLDLGPMVGTSEERFLAKVVKVGECWIWQGKHTPAGYGMFRRDGKSQYCHRWSYEHFTGNSIPDGYQVDHLCRTPSCVNPDHLEPVTPEENLRRSNGVSMINRAKTHCPRGHEYSAENTYFYQHRGAGHRQCRKCWAINKREQARRKRDLAESDQRG